MESLGHALAKSGAAGQAHEELLAVSRGRARHILRDLTAVQREMVMDPNPLVSGCCPRRAGKSYSAVAAALAVGEAKPYSVVLLITLTLKSGKRTYWHGSESGVPRFSRQYGLNLKFNDNELRWEHENGSVGYIMAAETRESIEYARGIEADLYIIDECKSFSPSILAELIDDIIMPQTVSRLGRVMMIGTPGNVMSGPFWDATGRGVPALGTEGETVLPARVPYGEDDPWGRLREDLWSYHHWSMQDNTAMAHQWAKALSTKRRKGWADDHPSWRREYLGEWVQTDDGLVYNYLACKAGGDCNWVPQRTPENPTGLPKELGPWRLVFGLDLGFQDPTALVVIAYSERVAEVRHVYDFKASHMVLEDVVGLVKTAIERFGRPDAMFADTGNLGRMIVESLRMTYGISVEAAAKTDKNDHIEILNSEMKYGRVKIIPGTDLEDQLSTDAWDLSDNGKAELARMGRLKEDRKIPNDLTDAFLYAFRGCYHHFAKALQDVGPEQGSVEWYQEQEKLALDKARRQWKMEHSPMLQRGPMSDSLPWKSRQLEAPQWLLQK